MLRVLSLFLLIACISQGLANVSLEKIVRYRDVVAGYTIEVSIHQGEYDFSKHKIIGGVEGSSGPAKIDGVKIAGTDGASPFADKTSKMVRETIREIQVKWNGVAIQVPKSLHINLLGLSLSNKTIQFIPNFSGDALLIQATGGDGGASYLVSLILRKDGKHRQIYHGYWEDPLPSEPKLEGVTWKTTKTKQEGAEQEAIR